MRNILLEKITNTFWDKKDTLSHRQISNKESKRLFIYFVFVFLLVLLEINVILSNFGPIFIGLKSIYTCIFLILLLFIFLSLLIKNYNKKLFFPKYFWLFSIGVFVIFFSSFFVASSNLEIIQLIFLSFLLLGIFITYDQTSLYTQWVLVIDSCCLGITLFYLVITQIPVFWFSFNGFSLRFSQLLFSELSLGASSSGLWIVSFFFIGFIIIIGYARCRIFHKIMLLIGNTVLLMVVWVLVLSFAKYWDFLVDVTLWRYLFLLFNVIFFVEILFLKQYIWNRNYFQEAIPKHSSSKKNIVFSLIIALFFLVAALLVFVPVDFGCSDKLQIGFYADSMLGDWRHPEYGKYGREASGMFGLLPLYLSSFGYESELFVHDVEVFINNTYPEEKNTTRFVNLTNLVKICEISSFSDIDFSTIDVFIIINHNNTLSSTDYSILWDYVNHGGGLLVLGDHTNVGDMLEPLNILLSPVDIEFKFDSALPLDDIWKWENCITLQDLGFAATLNDARDLQINVGASLKIGSNADPCILGRFGFSDKGDIDNAAFAYLGNYEHDPGEQIGDVVLAARSVYGTGRVMVFGDTSSFQNGALHRSYQLVDRVLRWLGGGDSKTMQEWAPLLVGLCLFGCIGILIWNSSVIKPFLLIGIPIIVIIIFSLIFMFSSNYLPSLDSEKHVLLDVSHIEQFSLDSFTDTSLSGFILNLQRNGFLPVFIEESMEYHRTSAAMIIFNNPTKKLSEIEVNSLIMYMENGGVVILSTGFSTKESADELLRRFEISIDNVPLGPVPYVEDDPASFEFEPRFVNSWPIIFSSESIQSFYNFTWGDQLFHLMVYQPFGQGGLLVIGDSEFLLDSNLESIFDYWPGNIVFLKHIFDEIINHDKEEMI